MRKVLGLVLVMMTAVAAFAYEPKVECAKVDKRGKIKYFETYYKSSICPNESRYFTVKKNGKFVYLKSGSFDDMWYELLGCRKRYDAFLNVAKYKDETCSTCAYLDKYKSAYENGELNEIEMKQYEAMIKLHGAANDLKSSIEGKPTHAKTATKSYYEVCANDEKRKAINEIPFVTEENWKTITKEEMLEMLKDFVEQTK